MLKITKITNDETKLIIIWNDGKQTEHNLLLLRINCPCALCRGGHDLDAKRKTDHIKQIQLISHEKVGRYGLRIYWSDNHSSGIYVLDRLRTSEGYSS